MGELRLRADAGDHHARLRLVDLFVEQGAADDLTVRANAGDDYASRVFELKARAVAGDQRAAVYVAHLGQADDSIVGLKLRRLAFLLAGRGLVGELRKRAARRDPYAARELVNVLATRGDAGGPRKLAAKRDSYAADRLTTLLAEEGRVDELWDWVRSRGPGGEPQVG